MISTPPISTLFPYTTLFRSTDIIKGTKRTLILSSKKQTNHKLIIIKRKKTRVLSKEPTNHKLLSKERKSGYYQRKDRKSTRLNSSHITISYAVFCLKKKKK